MSPSATDKPGDNHDLSLGETDARIEARSHLGDRLSQARQAKDIGINEASEQLRIRKKYLEALESGDWTALPEEVYVMGFLRQYANLLGVDLSQEIEDLKTDEYILTKPFTMPDPPIAMNRTWAIAAGACFLILLILFNVVDDGEEELHPIKLQASSPDAALDASTMMEKQGAEIPNIDSTVQQAETQSPLDHAAAAFGQATESASNTEQSTARPAAAQPPASISAPVAIKPEAMDSVRQVTPGPTGTHTTGRHTFHLTAVDQDVWLQLHKPDGSLAREALLRSGQSMRLNTDEDYLLLTSGNPLALSISIDGLPVAEPGTLGEKDKVLHDYRLPPAAPTDSGL